MPDFDRLDQALGRLDEHVHLAARASRLASAEEIRRRGVKRRQRRQTALAGFGVVVLGLGAGALALQHTPDSDGNETIITMATHTPSPTPSADQSGGPVTVIATAQPTKGPAGSPRPGATSSPNGTGGTPGAGASVTPSTSASPSPSRGLESYDVVAVGSFTQQADNYLRVEVKDNCARLAELFGVAFRNVPPTRSDVCVDGDQLATVSLRVDPRVAITPLASGSRLTSGSGPVTLVSFTVLQRLIETANDPVVVQIRVDTAGVIKTIAELNAPASVIEPSPQAGHS